MDTFNELRRWGLLLEVLTELADVEQQVIVQTGHPAVFIPDELLNRWHDIYQGGHGLSAAGISEEMTAILQEFDYNLDQLIDIVPPDADDKIIYIRYDTVWRAIRELAEWTMERIVDQSMPDEIELSEN